MDRRAADHCLAFLISKIDPASDRLKSSHAIFEVDVSPCEVQFQPT
jgi:hypothetical protein